jgi:hypothetical protein
MPYRTEPDSAPLEGDQRRGEVEQANKRPRRPRRDYYRPMYVPLPDAFEIAGVGKTKGFELINSGVLKTVRIGKRRFVTFESLERLAVPDDDSSEAA